jgi:uncharacterized protein
MKRIVVSGGTGLIGRAFIKKMVESGYEVVVLTRRMQAGGGDPAVKMAEWDGRTVGDWQHWLEGAQAVVNLAGENIGGGRWTTRRKERVLTSRLEAGQALVAAFERTTQKPPVLLQSSAIGYYGVTDGAVVESSPPGEGFQPSVCLGWEGSTQAVEAMGVRRVVMRTGVVLAREGGALPRLLPLFRLFAGGPLGDGRQIWSWISLVDEVGAMAFLLENESASGVFNLTAPNPVTMAELGKTLAMVLKRPYWLPAPAFALRLVLGEMSALLLDSQTIMPERLLQAGYVFQDPQIKGALESLKLRSYFRG